MFSRKHLGSAAPWSAAVAATALAAVVIVGSGAPPARAGQASHDHAARPAPSQTMPMATSSTSASALRTTLNMLLQEHVYLDGAATNAALGGRQAEFQAAAGALDANSVALSKAIGSVYGDAAEQAFLPLWRAHITMFVDYTQAAGAGDVAKKTKALADLDGYRTDFDAFLSGANPHLPRGAVAELLKPHVSGIAQAIDAQAAHDPARAYLLLREAANHMQMIGDPLAEAIVRQFPQRFAGTMRLQGRSEAAAQTTNVDIRQFAYRPTPLRVAAGSTVTWTNHDGAQHSVTHGTAGSAGGAFDSGLFAEGASFTHTFAEPGTYSYFCQRHPSMQGQIEVTP